MRTFEELGCYREAREYRRQVSAFCKTLPADERYRLADQLIRASRSATANIAEGFGRHHHQENLQFCRQARGSLSECLEHLNTALDKGYLTPDGYRELRAQLEQTWKVLNGFTAYLGKCVKEGVPVAAREGQPV